MEIGLGRGNANQQLARFIWEWQQECRMEVASIDGGNLANAIPRECKALVGVREECAADFEKEVREFSDMLHAEFLLAEEPSFVFEATPAAAPSTMIDSATARRLSRSFRLSEWRSGDVTCGRGTYRDLRQSCLRKDEGWQRDRSDGASALIGRFAS